MLTGHRRPDEHGARACLSVVNGKPDEFAQAGIEGSILDTKNSVATFHAAITAQNLARRPVHVVNA
jgi:hypothetical protein